MAGLEPSASGSLQAMSSVQSPSLVLDLDGTLIRNDLTFELFVLCARWQPFLLLRIAYIAIIDRPRAKRLLTERFAHHIDPKTLPYDPDVLNLIHRFKQSGHSIELVSGSDEQLVEAIARHIDIPRFKGSTRGVNLTGWCKADYLTKRHGSNFLYVGNSISDRAIWHAGQGGFGVNAPSKSYGMQHADGSLVNVKELVPRRSWAGPLFTSLRPHQWTKNLLLLIVPAIQIIHLDVTDGLKLLAALICFSLLASATYLINDLFDLQDDRRHRTKCLRPLASGLLSVPIAVAFVFLTLPTCLVASFLIDSAFGSVLVSYLIVTTLYSYRLKCLAVIDVFTLASLFAIRVIAGAYIVGYPPSGWLLTFVGCFFLSLAIGKRFIELQALGGEPNTPGRGYVAGDEIPLLATGSGIGMIAVLAMLIYGLSAPVTVFNSETVVLIGSALLLAWTMRFWLLAGRREISEDPVIYAIRDRTSLILLAAISLVFAFDLTSPLWTGLF